MTLRLALAGALLCALAFGQSATPTSYPTGLLNNFMMMEAQAVPSSPTVITTRNLIIAKGGWLSCSTTQSITLTDGNGKNIMPAVLVTAPAIYGLGFLEGTYVSGGFSLSATGAGCLYHLPWRQ